MQANGVANVRNDRQSLEDVELRGVTANIGDMDVEEVATGRYITDSDNQHRDMVCMIGADVADKLYGNADPLGKILSIDGQEFQIVGVAKRIGNTFGQSQDNFVYIPVETWLKIYGRNTRCSINIQARGPEWLERTPGRGAVPSCAPAGILRPMTTTTSAYSPATA